MEKATIKKNKTEEEFVCLSLLKIKPIYFAKKQIFSTVFFVLHIHHELYNVIFPFIIK